VTGGQVLLTSQGLPDQRGPGDPDPPPGIREKDKIARRILLAARSATPTHPD